MKANVKKSNVCRGSVQRPAECGEKISSLGENGIVGAFECGHYEATKCQRWYDGGLFDRCSSDAAVEGS